MKQPRGLESVVDRLRLKFRQLEAPETLPVFLRRPARDAAKAGKRRVRFPAPAADRPHELLSVLGEPVARLPDRRGLRAHAGTAIAGGAYCVCPQPR